jgi:MoaA/NifB/PqqE/SkfB family radical SAM enzyme
MAFHRFEDIISISQCDTYKESGEKEKIMGYLKEIAPKIIRYRLHRIGLASSGRPLNFTFSVTNACQSRCRTCNIWKVYKDDPSKRDEELDIGEIEKIFQSLGHVYIFNISGGEPFLRPDLPQIIKLACEYLRPAVIHLPTNAIAPDLVEQRMLEILKVVNESNPAIQFTFKPSLDHIGERHDDIRGVKGNFEKVITLFQRLKEHKRQFSNLHVELGTTISRWNVDDIDAITKFILGLEPDSYRNEIAEQRSEMFNGEDLVTLSPDEYRKAINVFIQNMNTGKKKKVFFQKLTNAFRLVYYDLAVRIMEERKQVIPCYAGISNAHMNPYGDIWPCCTLGYKMSMGNLRDYNYDFSSLWNSTRAAQIRGYIREGGCYCPLANQTYSNILMNWSFVIKAMKNIIFNQ